MLSPSHLACLILQSPLRKMERLLYLTGRSCSHILQTHFTPPSPWEPSWLFSPLLSSPRWQSPEPLLPYPLSLCPQSHHAPLQLSTLPTPLLSQFTSLPPQSQILLIPSLVILVSSHNRIFVQCGCFPFILGLL